MPRKLWTIHRILILVTLCIVFSGCAVPTPMWRAPDLAGQSDGFQRLVHNNKTLAQVQPLMIQKLIDVKKKIENVTGIKSEELIIVGNDSPNAFAAYFPQHGEVIGITTGMLGLLGVDWDAYAAIIGHEYAHHTLQHRMKRNQREEVRQGMNSVLSVLLRAANVPMSDAIANLGTNAVATIYSRDEEREADAKGFEYMVQAGFDPNGAIRAWEKFIDAGHSGAAIPFLSSHPIVLERIENMKALIAKLPTTYGTALVKEEVEVSDDLVIHGVTFANVNKKIIVKAIDISSRTNLQIGDAIAGCIKGDRRIHSLQALAACNNQYWISRNNELIRAEIFMGNNRQ